LDINDILGKLVSGEIVMVIQDEPDKPAQVKPKLVAEEQELADSLIAIAKKYGKFNEDETGIWAGYESAKDNVVAHIGVKCANCALYAGNGVCKIIAQKVEDGGKCRFAVIPDGVVKGVYDPAGQMPIVRTGVEKRRMKLKEEPATSGECPKATKDIATNLKNRSKAIKTAMYGPLNPQEPNASFYKKLAAEWDVAPDQARSQKCGNCAMFIVTPEMKSCIQKGVTGLGRKDEWDSIDAAGGLGYCEAFDFKCASERTCRAWVTGGPITETKSVTVRPSVKALGATIGSASSAPGASGSPREGIDHDMDGIIFEGTDREQRAPYKRQSNNKYEMDRRKFVRSELKRQGIKRNARVQDRSQRERDARAKARAAYDKMTYMAGLEAENQIERGRVTSPATTNPKPADRYPNPSSDRSRKPADRYPDPPNADRGRKPADRYPNPPKKYPPGQTPEGPSPATRNPKPADRYPSPSSDRSRTPADRYPNPSSDRSRTPADRYPNPPDADRGRTPADRYPNPPKKYPPGQTPEGPSAATRNPKPADRYPSSSPDRGRTPADRYPNPSSDRSRTPADRYPNPPDADRGRTPADRYPNPPKKYPPGQRPEGPSPATRNPRPADRSPNPPRRPDGGRGGRGFERGPSAPPRRPRYPADRSPNPPRRPDRGRERPRYQNMPFRPDNSPQRRDA